MPLPLDIELERFSHAGGIDGDGATRLLGRPPIEPLPLLIREAVQNSWDARDRRVNKVSFRVDLQNLSPNQFAVVRDRIFRNVPAQHDLLRRWLDKAGGRRILWVSDRGTVGLRGPTRADEVSDLGERNFSDLVRNLGRDQSLDPGGGTYGYGKSSLFRTSQCKTVIFCTRIRNGAAFETRFMVGSWIGRLKIPVNGRNVPHTGRMWWGRKSTDGIVDPILDDEADDLIGALGIPPFASGETGTTIGVLDPDTSGLPDSDAVRWVISSLLWNCWPKLVDLGSGPEMSFKVVLDGRDQPIPSLDQLPPLSGYAKALKLAAGGVNSRLQPRQLATGIEHGSYRLNLGRLAVVTIPRSNRSATLGTPVSTGGEEQQHPVMAGPSRHVALMRMPKLVVTYLPTAALPDDQLEYCGVFLSAGELERHFADAEPPSHDDWRPELLTDARGKSCVNVAVRKVKESVQDFFAPRQIGANAAGPQVSLGAFAGMMGELLAGTPGDAARPGAEDGGGGGGASGGGGGGGGGSVRRGRVKQYAAILRREGNRTIAVVPFDVVLPAGSSSLPVTAVASIMTGDGSSPEDSPPMGVSAPQVVGWIDPTGQLRAPDGAYQAPAGKNSVKVALPADAKVMIEIKVSR